MKPVLILSVRHDQQRYNTVGDYQETDSYIAVTVSQLPDWRYEALIAVHELVEKVLANHRGIQEGAIDQFDVAFETDRDFGDESEPGDQPTAPYHREHVFATQIERQLAAELGVDWADYERAIQAL